MTIREKNEMIEHLRKNTNSLEECFNLYSQFRHRSIFSDHQSRILQKMDETINPFLSEFRKLIVKLENGE
jgi:hypothetical protein